MERLRFDDLSRYLLLKNGNYLYKVPFRDGHAVLKVYYGDRSPFDYVTKTIGNLVKSNQTSWMPKARRKTELEVLDLWREAGFRVFDTYRDVVVEGLPEGGYTLFEYLPARRFVEYFGDESEPIEERLVVWRRFLPVWHRRHALAVERRDPRFVHENGDLKHVMMVDDEFLFFDFESVFRSRSRVREFVAREILAYLKSLGKTVGPGRFDAFLDEVVQHYPDHDLLKYTWAFSFRNPNPILRFGRWLDRAFRERANKPFSKYNVAIRLHQRLA